MGKNKTFIVKGLGEFFDGLLVEVKEEEINLARLGSSDYVPVARIRQRTKLFKSFSLPIVEKGLYIDSKYLEAWNEPKDDLMTDNPYGKYKSEGKVERDGFSLTWALFSRALTVNVRNRNNVLFTQTFYEPAHIIDIKEFITEISESDEYDMDEVVFDLQELSDNG